MSRNHSSMANDVNRIINDIEKMDISEAERLHGITINEDSTVYDHTYNISFDNITEWAKYNSENDHVEFEEHFSYTDRRYL